MTIWGRIADVTIRRSRATLVGIALVTLFFAFFLVRIRVDTSFLSFVRPETRALVDTIENDFGEGAYLTLIFEARGDKSLFEPELLKHQLRIMRDLEARFRVTTFSLVEGIDRGLVRVKRQSLDEVDDYSTIAEAILGLAGGRTVRDLMKVSAHWISNPEAVEFYANLRVAQSVGVLAAPGAPDSHFRVPEVRAIRALVRAETGDTRAQRRLLFARIRDAVDGWATPDLVVHVLSDDLVAHDIDENTQRSAVLLGLTVLLVDLLCVWALFRSGREIGIVFTILAVSAIWTFGLAALLGIEISFLHLLVFPILLGTGIDDSLVFGRRLAEESRAGFDFDTALRRTFEGCGTAILLTTVTTFVAFLATGLTAVAAVFASFFVLVALAMAFELILTLLLQGALRSRVEAWSTRGGTYFGKLAVTSPLDSVNAAFMRGSRWIGDRGARPVVLVLTVALVVSAISATRLDSEMARDDLLQPGMPSHGANEALQRHFGDFRIGYVHFGGDVARAELLTKLKELARRLAACDEIEKVLGTANVESVVELIEKFGIRISPGMDVGAAFERVQASDRISDYAVDMSFGDAFDYVVHASEGPLAKGGGSDATKAGMVRGGPAYDGLLLRYFVTGEKSSRSLAAVAAIEKEIEALGLDRIPGVTVRIGGGDVIYPLESVYYAETLARSFAYALAGNLVVLWIAWRRLGKALLAIAPVVVAATIVIGMMPVFGVALNALNLGVSAILVGMGVDYPIHWIERYDEERTLHQLPPREAASIALEEMGPHLLAAMLTTAIGFCAATVMLLPMSTSFGLTMGAAILLVYVLTIFALPTLVVAGDERRLRRGA